MASTGAKERGIYAWMASVRASMANDPCRQLFEDQIHTHAFIFLDDYLEQILAGPKHGPIIELVKTPGRKKNVPRRTRAATAATVKVGNDSLFSLGDDDSAKVNVPVNDFHKALLQAKERSAQGRFGPRRFPTHSTSSSNLPTEKTRNQAKFNQVVVDPETITSIEPESQASPTAIHHCPKDPSDASTTPFLAVECGTELSVIAEGDESPERSHANMVPSSIASPNGDVFPETVPLSHGSADDYLSTEGKSKTIPRSHKPQGNTSPDAQYLVLPSADAYHSVSLASSAKVQPSEANHTDPLPSRSAVHTPGDRQRNAFTAPLPAVPLSSVPIPHIISVPLNDLSPRTLAYKNGTAGFPTLPAPSPLRKSMRVTQDALAGSAIPSAAPALAPLGKRTSWLMKAREAKAMDGTSSFQGNPAAPVPAAMPRVSTAVKRKSEEMLDPPSPGPNWEKDQRKPKVAKSAEIDIVLLTSKETVKTNRHDLPPLQGDPVHLSPIAAAALVRQPKPHATDIDEQIDHTDSTEEGFIDLFKRTVEGLGARSGKSVGKSLGGSAAAALAEARAAAEAKVAQRNEVDGGSSDSDGVRDVALHNHERFETRTRSEGPPFVSASPAEGNGHRLSLSDLAPDTLQHNKLSTAGALPAATRISIANEGISTTPLASPLLKGTSSFVKPIGPVFNRPPPPPVFMPPASKIPPKQLSFNVPPKHMVPAAVTLGIPAQLPSPNGFSTQAAASLQPLQSSTFSDSIHVKHEGALSKNVVDNDDDDDSWPLEEKLTAAESGWRPFDFSNVDKEDTWSSLPTESQGPTRNFTAEEGSDDAETNNEDAEREKAAVEISDAEDSVMEVRELEATTETAVTNLGRMEPTARGTNQTSIASAASSSRSQVGFFSQATKLVNTMLSGGKKARPELKSLQLAAAAAKRQQEEADKKTQRLKDMEARRQTATAKKAEEERTRLLEEEKKTKEELEKRKREREENTDRRPLKPPVSTKKAEGDTSKKRRLAPETEKKLESKRAPSKDKKDLGAPAKTPATKLATQKVPKATTTALVSSAAYNTTQNAPPAPSTKSAIPEAKPFKVVSSSLKGKAKATPQEDDMADKLPSTLVQSQMAARAKAQMQAAKLPTPEVPSESIELPDINSEYSDSDDEDRVRTFDPPDWAQSPELRQALQMQSTMNPDNIFGTIRPLRMEEMFRNRQSRFRARSSSANWSGTDRLTIEEIREYERRMGFQQIGTS